MAVNLFFQVIYNNFFYRLLHNLMHLFWAAYENVFNFC